MQKDTGYQTEYKTKLTDSDTAAEQIETDSIVGIGQAVCQPPALMQGLAERARAGKVDNVKVYYMHSEEHMKNSLLRYELMGRIKPHCMFLQATERELIKKGVEDGNRKVVYFVPNSFSQSIRFFTEHMRTGAPVTHPDLELDAFLVTVSPMDRHGYFTFGTNNDYTSTAARAAKRLIVEVNQHMPRVFGRSQLHISEVAAIVENDAPLLALKERPIREHELKLAARVAELIPDRACLQIGVGGVGRGVCHALMDRTDLGIHTEVFNPALARLIQRGAVTNKWKNINPGKTVFTFAMGDQALYDFMDDNISVESHPVNYVNDPAVIAQNDRVVSVNSTIEMDLTGACNSEYLDGHQFTATGGQLDFVRGAYASKGGLSIIAFQSSIKNGTISKIVSRLSGPVTTPRTDVHYVVTENGVVNLKGLSSTERALSLINLADAAFRENLLAEAKQLHLV